MASSGSVSKDARPRLSDASNNAPVEQAPEKPSTSQSRAHRLYGVEPVSRFSREGIKAQCRKLLNISFDLNDVQAEIVRRMDMGYDVFCIMGTGYGKTITYEAIAALNPKHVVIVLCPLKALEYDQAAHAREKGLTACPLNEDTLSADGPVLMTRIERGEFQLVYVSAEMATSARFTSLMFNPSFRRKLKLLVIDEAHVIAEWAKNFRKAYGEICMLRSFTAEDIPFAAFSATVTTEAFDVLFPAMGFGARPFWGVDAGTRRPELSYIVMRKSKVPVACMNALSLIPADISDETAATDIPKSIFYLEKQADCIQATQTVRRCLPESLRSSAVRPFSSVASTAAKEQIWSAFESGVCRILCATDAAGMGCNIGDIEYCAIFDLKGPWMSSGRMLSCRHRMPAVLSRVRISRTIGSTASSIAGRAAGKLFQIDWSSQGKGDKPTLPERYWPPRLRDFGLSAAKSQVMNSPGDDPMCFMSDSTSSALTSGDIF